MSDAIVVGLLAGIFVWVTAVGMTVIRMASLLDQLLSYLKSMNAPLGSSSRQSKDAE